MRPPNVREDASSSLPASDSERVEGLVSSHRHLCARGARKFARPHLERADLEQVAAVALVKAARRYDPARATPFEAYAWRHVVGELMHYVRDCEYHVRIPRALLSLERRVTLARDAFVARAEREPRAFEIADELGVPVARIDRARGARQSVAHESLDRLAALRHPASGALGIDDQVLMEHAFARLRVVERRIVGGVYFLGLSQRQLARALDLSPKRVSRIHLGALASMRREWPSA